MKIVVVVFLDWRSKNNFTKAGRKKENQQIPHSIEIQLMLPEEILIMLADDKFGVKPINWWAIVEDVGNFCYA